MRCRSLVDTYNLNWLIQNIKMSKKRVTEVSLSEKLSSLIHTKPSSVESDDDDLTTVDKIAPNENDSEYSAEEFDVSAIRRINNVLLEEEDKKYSGKGIFRKKINDSLSSDLSEAEENQSNGTLSEEDLSDSGTEEEDETISKAEVLSHSDDLDDKITSNNYKNHDEDLNKNLFLKAGSDIEKGRAITNQLHIWDFLLKCRMKFQKCLIAANQFPNHKTFPEFRDKGNPSFQVSVSECRKSLKHLLNSLLNLQNVLLSSNEDTLTLSDNQRKPLMKNDEEEILSESEKEENSTGNQCHNSIKKLKTLEDFSKVISNRHTAFQCYQNKTIQKWNEKTRIGCISSKNFSAFEQSILKHIEHVLLDKQRLIKRTQTKRSDYHILGELDEPPAKRPAVEANGNLLTSKYSKNKNVHKEIFDDDDFYHQLLSEMVKRNASDVTDPVQLGRQWMQLQKMRSKMKKTVDTKASKGRKVRFVVHPKLVNFMMPVDNSNYKEDSSIELFNSLFGKIKK